MGKIVLKVSFIVLLGLVIGCQGQQCTYAALNLELYDCFYSYTVLAEYALPVVPDSTHADLFCTINLPQINSCVEANVQNCSSESTVTSFFGDGTALTDAYTYLCSEFIANSKVEPLSCTYNVSQGNIKGYLNDFDNSVDALSSPTLTEVCTLADTMISSFMAEINTACSSSPTSVTIWSSYTSRLRSACNSAVNVTASLILVGMTLMSSFIILYSL